MAARPRLFSCAFLLLAVVGLYIAVIDTNNQQIAVEREQVSRNSDVSTTTTKTVIIIGAGASGLSAAYTLMNNGIDDILILEASGVFGGRVRKDDTQFIADYPIDLGGSFLEYRQLPHEIIKDDVRIGNSSNKNNKKKIRGNFVVKSPVSSSRCAYYSATSNQTEAKFFTSFITRLYMFVNYTWFDFLADCIAPPEPYIMYNCQVNNVNYYYNQSIDGNRKKFIQVDCTDNRTYFAEYVIVTVPLSVLIDEDITFNPSLPKPITSTKRKMWSGFKVFIEFSKKFYDDFFCWRDDNKSCFANNGENIFWDYSHVQNSSRHLLSGCIVGTPAQPYANMNESMIVKEVLKRLDYIYNGQATNTYLKHIVVNWSSERFIRGTYSNTRLKPFGAQHIQDKVFIAGEAFPLKQNENGWVHSAVFSGRDASRQVLHLLYKLNSSSTSS